MKNYQGNRVLLSIGMFACCEMTLNCSDVWNIQFE